MAASAERRPRRGPAPIASFDHDVSDEVSAASSPENKQTTRLPDIREDPSCSTNDVAACAGDSLAPPEQRARSHSSPAVHAAAALRAPGAPRIDISRASSSSHHDSRDSSPELALFAGAGGGGAEARAQLELGFREDGALDLRSSTEELAFLEGAPGGPEPRPPPPAPPAPPSRRHSRKDSQGSEAALLGVSGRTSRLSSVGSQCSALSAFSRASRLSAASGASRSPSPHKMLLETSFCGPKPIETDPEICAAAVEQRLLQLATGAAVDARDRREVRTEATVESARPASAPRLASPGAPPPTPAPAPAPSCSSLDDDKRAKEARNRARAEERRERAPSQAEVHRRGNRTKDIIRIKLKPDDEYDNPDEDESERTLTGGEAARKPASLALAEPGAPPRDCRTPASLALAEPGAPPRDCRTPASLALAEPGAPPRDCRTPASLALAEPGAPPRDCRTPASLALAEPGAPPRDCRTPASLALAEPGAPPRDCRTPASLALAEPGAPPRDCRTPASLALAEPGAPPRDCRTPASLALAEPGAPPRDCRTPASLALAEPGAPPRDCRTPASLALAEPGAPPRDCRTPSPSGAAVSRKSSFCSLFKSRETIASPDSPSDALRRKKSLNEGRSRSKSRDRSATPTSAGKIKGSVLALFKTRPSPSPSSRDASPGAQAPRQAPQPPPDRQRGEKLKYYDEAQNGIIHIPLRTPPDEPLDARRPASAPQPPARRTVLPDGSILIPLHSPTAASAPEPDPDPGKERIMFSTHVGSEERVFCTQFSITKTPSVTSEISESIPSFPESEEARGADPPRAGSASPASSGSEASSDVERRGLVVQESFEELPYVPTTLPLERSLALPMVPVRERGGVRVAPLQRPRARRPSAPLPALPSPGPPPAAPSGARLHIRLPGRAGAAPRARSRSGGDAAACTAARGKGDWIDFAEVPERRKQAKRIQTLPAAAARDAVLFVPPERCRCECHAHAAHAAPDAHDHTEASLPPRPH
nr:proline-rich protein 36-like [Maniola hyperantus]